MVYIGQKQTGFNLKLEVMESAFTPDVQNYLAIVLKLHQVLSLLDLDY